MSGNVRVGALAACLLLIAATQPPVQAAPASADWPRWESPEEAGFSSERLAEAQRLWESIDDAPLAAFFLVYRGRVLTSFGDVTAAQVPLGSQELHEALYGPHVANGNIDLETAVGELGIDDDPPLTEAEKQARVIDLLMARSGVYHEAACETQGMRDARPARGSHPPGTFWFYNNWDFNALGTIFRQETGRDIFEEFKRKIARRVGMQDFRTSRCSYYYETEYSDHPCYVFRMSARDRARFGQLFLQRGRWGNRQIVPEAWVYESTQPYSDTEWWAGTPGQYYGYMWWSLKKKFFATSSEDRRLHHLWGYAASGYGGQLIMVLPDAEMVIVTASDVPAGAYLQDHEWGPVVETMITAREIVDLEIRRPRVRERLATSGETVHLKAKIKNRSTARTMATTVEFYLTSPEPAGKELHRLGSATLGALTPGKRKTVRLTALVPEDLEPGHYHLIALVDDEKTSYDLRRSNNQKTTRQALEFR
jgi:CubicO group peptidase (beta-lactamase class C family)